MTPEQALERIAYLLDRAREKPYRARAYLRAAGSVKRLAPDELAARVAAGALEINSRPERLDPPNDLLALAVDAGCRFAIDTDAHAPGQLEWLGYGADKAVETGVPVDRVVNTWPADRLLAWTRR